MNDNKMQKLISNVNKVIAASKVRSDMIRECREANQKRAFDLLMDRNDAVVELLALSIGSLLVEDYAQAEIYMQRAAGLSKTEGLPKTNK